MGASIDLMQNILIYLNGKKSTSEFLNRLLQNLKIKFKLKNMKTILLIYLIEFVSFFWRLIPWIGRHYFFLIPIVLEGRGKHIKAFERLLEDF